MKTSNTYFLSLDIETSSIEENEKPIAVWLSYGVIKLYNVNLEVIEILKFRKWSDLDNFLFKVSNNFINTKIFCYVHNLSFEFDFMIKNISKMEKMLTNSTHKVITCTLEKYNNIEFRCTYCLSGYSLKKIGDIVSLPKLDSDYRAIYPNEEVTKDEWEYCERDVDIVAYYITKICLPKYKLLMKIPYTKTGVVRNKLKEYYKKSSWDLMPDKDCVKMMEETFQGAITISNPLFTNRILTNVHSYDETSAYPYVMLKEKFPRYIRKGKQCEIDYLNASKSFSLSEYYLATIKFKNICSKYKWAWLSVSKMDEVTKDAIFFNGKLISASYIIRKVTNVDFESIKKTYDFEDYEVLEYFPLDGVDYLPKEFFETIDYFAKVKHENKKEFKKVEHLDITIPENKLIFTEKLNDYMLSKNNFNSIYGMMVMKLVRQEFEITEFFEWKLKDSEYIKNENVHLKRNFLFGIYITAYARRNLLLGIIKNCQYSFVYADTDSIKFIGENKFIDTNEKLNDYLLEKEYLKDLGKFDYEGTYEKFITYGAKKYCYYEDGLYKPVVAGLPKTTLNSFEEFKLDKIFYKCKNAHRYISHLGNYTKVSDNSESQDFEKTDKLKKFFKENDIESNGGVAIFKVDYKLDMTENDKNYLKEEDLKTWLQIYKANGIDLTKYCNMTFHTTL